MNDDITQGIRDAVRTAFHSRRRYDLIDRTEHARAAAFLHLTGWISRGDDPNLSALVRAAAAELAELVRQAEGGEPS